MAKRKPSESAKAPITFLVSVMNGEKVIDWGCCVVLSHHDKKTHVLTCAHILQAVLGENVTGDKPEKVMVGGAHAKVIADPELQAVDLVVLDVDGCIGTPATLLDSGSLARQAPVIYRGFGPFFKHQFARKDLKGHFQKRVEVAMPDGTELSYLQIKLPVNEGAFEKGMSGGPICDARNNVIGIARISEAAKKDLKESHGYAIRLTPQLINQIQANLPSNSVATVGGAAPQPQRDNTVTPPTPPPPLEKSIADDDLQKGRWGGRSQGYGRKLSIENVIEYSRWFYFDAVLSATDGAPLQGPFVFHLHDSFTKSVIWIRTTRGGKAVLSDIDSRGTFTLGVQFKDKQGKWRSLEFDLASYSKGRLKKYDK